MNVLASEWVWTKVKTEKMVLMSLSQNIVFDVQ